MSIAEQRRAGKHDEPPGLGVSARLAQRLAPRRGRIGGPHVQEVDRGLDEDDRRDPEGRRDDRRSDGVGEHVPAQDARGGRPERPRRGDVVRAEGEQYLGAYHARQVGPSRQSDRPEQGRGRRVRDHGAHDEDEHQRRE